MNSSYHYTKKQRGRSCWTAYDDVICLFMMNKVNKEAFNNIFLNIRNFYKRNMIDEHFALYYFWYSVFHNSHWSLVFTILIFVDTAVSCDVIFRGCAFASISLKNECHVMYFYPMKETKMIVLYNILIYKGV